MNPSQAAIALMLAISGLANAVPNPEVEPNNTKAQATLANSGGPGMAAGDTITGATTGTSTTATGSATADYFRVKTAALPLGIYRNRLSLTSIGGSNAYEATLRGLDQNTTGIVAGSDVVIQTAQSSTTTPPRFVQWYGFGKQEEIYYRVTGLSFLTGSYAAQLSVDPVTPIIVSGTVAPGPVTIGPGPLNPNDTDFWLYDGNLNPVATFGADTPQSATRTLTPGDYYIAWSNWNLANNQGNPSTETSRNSAVLDFPNAVANSSTLTFIGTSFNVSITSSAGTITVAAPKNGPFDVAFVKFTIQAPVQPTPLELTGGAATVRRGPGNPSRLGVLTATLVPGFNPTSSGIAVSADLSSIGGGSNSPMRDDGINGDAVAGDNVWSLRLDTTGLADGSYSFPVAASDAQGRTATSTATLLTSTQPLSQLGTLPTGGGVVSAPGTLSAADISWFRVTTTVQATDPAGYLDIWTTGSQGSTLLDTEIALYRADGTLVAADDDDGDGTFSALSFGRVAPARPGSGNGLPFNGRDGGVPAGTYYIAVGAYDTVFNSSDFVAVSTSTFSGAFTLNLASDQTRLTGASSPTSILKQPVPFAPPPYTGPVVVRTTGGLAPASTGIAVRLNTSVIGGPSSVVMRDDGTQGDAVAQDGNFTITLDVTGTADGVYQLPFTVTDAQGRSDSGTLPLTVTTGVVDLGALNLDSTPRAHTRTVPAGRTLWYAFTVPAISGSAWLDLHTGGSLINDTELGLYDATGLLIASNDDWDAPVRKSGLSFGLTSPVRLYPEITNPGVQVPMAGQNGSLAAGRYFLAFNEFDAVFSGGFGVPTSGTDTGDITVNIIGFAEGTPPVACLADVNTDGVIDGTDFVLFINSFAIGDVAINAAADVAGGGTGAVPDPDGNIDGSDFVAFINAFALGC